MTKPLHFVKMHGLGNDFVIINALHNSFLPSDFSISKLANRHLGIGFDQLLILKPTDQALVYCQIFNADGSEAQQCGNGLRCVARYLHEEGITQDTSFAIETLAGIFPLEMSDYQHIRIAMGKPKLQAKLTELDHTLTPNQKLKASILSLGNPHAIIKVESLDAITPGQLGPIIAKILSPTEGINIGFIEIIDKKRLKLKTFERGTGETHACGSNACAAVMAGIINNWVDNKVEVTLTYGSLLVEWPNLEDSVYLTGSAERVFKGVLE